MSCNTVQVPMANSEALSGTRNGTWIGFNAFT